MNQRLLIVLVKWLAGVIAYIVLSVAASRGFLFVMLRWAYAVGVSRYAEIELTLMTRWVFAICLFWGALYTSALAKPAAFGHAPRILKHLGWSFLLGLLGCILLARMVLLHFPHFRSFSALHMFVIFGCSLSILCFVFALATWVHLAFGGGNATAKQTSEIASPNT